MREKKTIFWPAAIIVLSLLACGQAKIILYGAPWCGYCKSLEEYLIKNNVSFQKINVDRDKAGWKETQRKSGQSGIPVLDWEGEIIIGFGNVVTKEIYRLISGGTPVGGKFQQGKTHIEEVIDYEERINTLNKIFERAQKNTDDANAIDILAKLSEAHTARIVYEATFTEQFQKKYAETSSDGNESGKVVRMAGMIAGSRYLQTFGDYRDARGGNLQASIKAQKALKLAIAAANAQPLGYARDEPTVVQNYFLKLWACAALDPATGRKIEVRFAGKVNLQQDKITIKAAKSLDEIAGIEKTDVNDVEDPNNLWQ